MSPVRRADRFYFDSPTFVDDLTFSVSPLLPDKGGDTGVGVSAAVQRQRRVFDHTETRFSLYNHIFRDICVYQEHGKKQKSRLYVLIIILIKCCIVVSWQKKHLKT